SGWAAVWSARARAETVVARSGEHDGFGGEARGRDSARLGTAPTTGGLRVHASPRSRDAGLTPSARLGAGSTDRGETAGLPLERSSGLTSSHSGRIAVRRRCLPHPAS